MIVTAIVLAIIAAFVDWWIGIAEPWRKIVMVGIIFLLAVGIIVFLFPGLIPIRLGVA